MKHQVLISKGIRLAGLLCCFIALAIFVAPARTMAQDTATLSGTVTDKTGSSVPGASVVITSQGGNLTRSTETNADGAYVAAALPNGKYDLVITAQGFQRFQVTGIKLDVAQKARVDVSLTVGATTQEITVTGENVAQVDTQSAEVGSTITGKQVQQLELNGRNFTQLVQLSPGVINQTGQDEGVVGVGGSTSYSINGGRIEYNNWEIDGGDNMDNGSNNSLNVYPNIEAIAEFKVLTSNYGAQYGKNASGTVEVETKSGTDQFHGSAFYYGRNDAFNANNWERNGQGLGKPPYKKHDWGYTVGGPVFIPHLYNNEKKKTFVFWSQEWRRELVPGSLISQAVPSDAERTGDFTDVCPAYTGAAFDPAAFPSCPYQPGTAGKPFVNNQLPTPFSSTANAILNLIPKANNFGASGNYTSGPNTGSPLPTYLSNPSYNTHWREELIRIDHNLTENYRLTFRYIHDTWGTVNQGPLWGSYNNSFDNSNTSFVGPTTSFVARLTANFTPTLLNEFVASYTDDHIFLTTIGNVNLPSGGIDLLPFFPDSFNKTNKLPAFNIGGTTDGNVYGGGFGVDTGYFPWKNANPTYTYRDIVTKTWRNHTFFFGAYVVAAQKNQQATLYPQGSLTFDTNNPKTTGNPFADMLTAQISGYSQTSTQPYFYDRYKIFEPFFQDDWRVSKKLTVNLGLRWSIYGRYQEKFNQEYGFSIKDYNLANAPSYFAYNSDSSQFLDSTTGNVFNGIIQCEAKGVQTGCLQNKYMNPVRASDLLTTCSETANGRFAAAMESSLSMKTATRPTRSRCNSALRRKC